VSEKAKLDKHPKERGQELRHPTTTMAMRIDPEPEFCVLAEQLVDACDRVRCSPEEYIAGMRYVLGVVEVALQAAKEKFPPEPEAPPEEKSPIGW
jgi:hypothetical protein